MILIMVEDLVRVNDGFAKILPLVSAVMRQCLSLQRFL